MGERSKQFPIGFKHLEQKTFISSTSSKSLFFKAFIYISNLVKGFLCNDLLSIHNPQESRFLTVKAKNMFSEHFPKMKFD